MSSRVSIRTYFQFSHRLSCCGCKQGHITEFKFGKTRSANVH